MNYNESTNQKLSSADKKKLYILEKLLEEQDLNPLKTSLHRVVSRGTFYLPI